jgi:murein L,D-transpeptidase YafK
LHRWTWLRAGLVLAVLQAVWAGGPALAGLPQMAPAAEQATVVVVLKSERRLVLRRGEAEIAAYPIALGFEPEGPKRRKGDGRTPEGRYVIDWRNAGSAYHLSLHISYPSERDLAAAATAGDDPGGMIMIHGLPNGRGWIGQAHNARDWTEGCIAVTSDQIEEIWSRVPDGTPIEILP